MLESFFIIFFFLFSFSIICVSNISLYVEAINVDEFDKINLCCTWGDKIGDGILTYKILASDKYKVVIQNAIDDWNTKLNGLIRLEPSINSLSDIEIKFKENNTGKIAGQSTINYGPSGFIDNVKIILNAGAFGKPLTPPIMEIISKHELGHAFGIGHSNFKNSLMRLTHYNNESLQISGCEINAVIDANMWKLKNNSNFPYITVEKFSICKH